MLRQALALILFLSLLFPANSLFSQEPELGLSDDALLDLIQSKSFEYFLMERDRATGLVRDRAHNSMRGAKTAPASIAATGFALTIYPIAVERDWIDYGTARSITVNTLRFFLKRAENKNGFFYHFLDLKSGARAHKSEISPIDTALLVAGALFAAEYYEDAEIRELANKIYERIQWDWMARNGKFLALAWSPEDGFHKMFWDHYDESMIMYLLAIGSPTHPLKPESWHAMKRQMGSYGDYKLIQMPPLFTHQYSHMWIDFRNKNDGHADYFENSVKAAKANRQFCMDHAAEYKSYGANSWGLTASDGPFGYKAYGAPPGWAVHDGTIAPTGCGSSIVFTPTESLACLRYFYEQMSDKLWGLYGFSDAFNLDKDWVASDVIGIDQGALIIMIENHRSEFVWKHMMENTYIRAAMDAIGFKEGTLEPEWADPPLYEAPHVMGSIRVDGFIRDWPRTDKIVLSREHLESGLIEDDKDLKAEISFAWDEEGLYFLAKVTDQNVLARKSGKNIWQDDVLELFIDPQGDLMKWSGEDDFQIGFRADDETGDAVSWSWFQGGEDPQESAQAIAKSFVDDEGYIIEGLIRWSFLETRPQANEELHLSAAIHDIDRDRRHTKVQWFMRSEDKFMHFRLGRILLLPKKAVEA